MTAINQDPVVMEHFPEVEDESATQRFMEKVCAHQTQHGYSLYAVEGKTNGEFMGFVGLLQPSFDAHFTPTTEIGWRLGSAY